MASLLNFSNEDETVVAEKSEVQKPERPSFSYSEPTVSTQPQKSSVQPVEDYKKIIAIDPEDCLPWRYADRPSDEMGDIDTLATSLKEFGQQEPILVRMNTQGTKNKYEIIFGNRRWRAAKKAKIKLEAVCKEVTDQQAALYQKEENNNRKELSNYARALSYKSQIDGAIFKNESELSKFLGISKQTLSDIMAYLRVPEELRNAISNYRHLSKNMVSKLAKYSKEQDKLEVLLFIAPKISDKSVTTNNIDKIIKEYTSPKIIKDKKIFSKKNDGGNDIYRIEPKSNGKIIVTLNKHITRKINPEILNEKLLGFLDVLIQE